MFLQLLYNFIDHSLLITLPFSDKIAAQHSGDLHCETKCCKEIAQRGYNLISLQVSWYFKKTKSNKMTGNRGQAMIIVAQTLGIAGAIYITSNPESKFNPVL
jgi:hypothetical protein